MTNICHSVMNSIAPEMVLAYERKDLQRKNWKQMMHDKCLDKRNEMVKMTHVYALISFDFVLWTHYTLCTLGISHNFVFVCRKLNEQLNMP